MAFPAFWGHLAIVGNILLDSPKGSCGGRNATFRFIFLKIQKYTSTYVTFNTSASQYAFIFLVVKLPLQCGESELCEYCKILLYLLVSVPYLLNGFSWKILFLFLHASTISINPCDFYKN